MLAPSPNRPYERHARQRFHGYERELLHHNFFFTPETLCGLVGRVGRFDVTAMEFASAHVRRWHTVPLHPIMMLGSDVIDWLSVLLGRRYRIILYVRKIG
jgi:hypothetical protein